MSYLQKNNDENLILFLKIFPYSPLNKLKNDPVNEALEVVYCDSNTCTIVANSQYLLFINLHYFLPANDSKDAA